MNETTCKRVPVETGMHVVVEPARIFGWERKSDAEREVALQRWANELMEFFRDHRSMDVNSIYIHKETEQRCSACNYDWEQILIETGNAEEAYIGCAHCSAKVE